jgi:hypothetical protein
MTHKYKFHECFWGVAGPAVPEPLSHYTAAQLSDLKPNYCKPQVGKIRLYAGMNIKGVYKSNQVVNVAWIPVGEVNCHKINPDAFVKVNCGKRPPGPIQAPNELEVFGHFRFPPGNPFFMGVGPLVSPAACVSLSGTMEVGPATHAREAKVFPADENEPCNWSS